MASHAPSRSGGSWVLTAPGVSIAKRAERGGLDPMRSAVAWGVLAMDAMVAAAAAGLEAAAEKLSGERVSAEAVHELRTVLRRLDTAVKAYRPVLGKRPAAALRELVEPLRRRAGVCRDFDVGLEQVAAWRKEGVWCAGLEEWLRSQRRAALGTMRAGDARELARRLVERWRTLREGVEGSENDERPAKKFARRRLERRVERSCALLEAASDAVRPRKAERASPMDAVHELRLSIKGLRYTVEVFTPALGQRRAKELVKGLKRTQDRLGSAVDAWTLSKLAGRFGRGGGETRGAGRVADGLAGRGPEVKAFRQAAETLALKEARKGVEEAREALESVTRTA